MGIYSTGLQRAKPYLRLRLLGAYRLCFGVVLLMMESRKFEISVALGQAKFG